MLRYYLDLGAYTFHIKRGRGGWVLSVDSKPLLPCYRSPEAAAEAVATCNTGFERYDRVAEMGLVEPPADLTGWELRD